MFFNITVAPMIFSIYNRNEKIEKFINRLIRQPYGSDMGSAIYILLGSVLAVVEEVILAVETYQNVEKIQQWKHMWDDSKSCVFWCSKSQQSNHESFIQALTNHYQE